MTIAPTAFPAEALVLDRRALGVAIGETVILLTSALPF